MTLLCIADVHGTIEPALGTTSHHDIAARLSDLGARYERRLVDGAPAAVDVEGPEVTALVAAGLGRWAEEVRQRPGDMDPAEAASTRDFFFNEHTHEEDEVWWFVDGRAAFYLHVGDTVAMLVTGPGDLLSIPAGMRHWFDMGAEPDFRAIRFYRTSAGFDGAFTAAPIASRFPHLEELVAAVSR